MRIKLIALVVVLLMWLPTPMAAQDFNAAAGIAYNPKTQQVLWGQNENTTRSIASLTKMMTAWVLFEQDPDLTKVVTVSKSDVRASSTTYLRRGDQVALGDLLHLMLIGSDNVAARVIARTATTNFVTRMNAAAKSLGLTSTRYVDSSGLGAGNVSTALDTAKLLSVVSENPTIASIMQMRSWGVRVGRRYVLVKNTNHLVADPDYDVKAGKTGYTSKSGFCVASMLRMVYGEDTVFVVLGAKTNPARFDQLRRIANWAAEKFNDPMRVVSGLPPGLLRQSRVCGMFPDSVSPEGIAFIKEHESFRPRAYRDSGRVWTIGYGFTKWKGRKVTSGYPGRVSRAQADVEFGRQLTVYEGIVRSSVCSVFAQSAYDSLVSIAWNLGRVNTLIVDKLALGGSGDLHESDFLSTATVRGRFIPGLLTRRAREFAMFIGSY